MASRPQIPLSVAHWRAAVLVLALALTACSSDTPKIEAAGVGAAALSPAAGSGLSVSPEEVAQSGPSQPFNPFSEPATSLRGGREVIANPSKADVLAQASALPEFSLGTVDAPVTLVQYASLTCPYCARFHAEVFPLLKREYIDTGKVRYILREFPIGHTSGQATLALKCAPPEKYLALYGRFMAEQAYWVALESRIDEISVVAAKEGVSRSAYDACRADSALVEGLKLIKDRGRKLGIIGTPNFFVNEKLVKKALTIEELRAQLDAALEPRAARAADGTASAQP